MYHQLQTRLPLRSRVVALLRRRITIPGQVVAASYEELADDLGSGFTARGVHLALLELGREAFVHGRPHLSGREFRGRLAW
jgi:hypothetical protein